MSDIAQFFVPVDLEKITLNDFGKNQLGNIFRINTTENNFPDFYLNTK